MVVRVRTLDVEKRIFPSDEDLARVVRGAMEDLLYNIYERHNAFADHITRYWQPENKPIFDYEIYRNFDTIGIIIEISTRGGLAWQYLDYGTPPHPITPRERPFMRFKSLSSGYQKGVPGQTYLSSTIAGDLRYSRKAEYLGDVRGAFSYVWHPGVEPRSYSEIVSERLQSRIGFLAGIFLTGNTGFYYDELYSGDYRYIRSAGAQRLATTRELDELLLGINEAYTLSLDLFE